MSVVNEFWGETTSEEELDEDVQSCSVEKEEVLSFKPQGKEFKWSSGFKKTLRNFFSRPNQILINIVDDYQRHVETEAKRCKKKPNRAFHLAKQVAGMLYTFRMVNGDFHTDDYLERIVRLLVIYTNLELRASLRNKESNLTVARRISFNLDLHLNGIEDNFHICSILLQTNGLSRPYYKDVAIYLYEKYLVRKYQARPRQLADNLFVMQFILFKQWKLADADQTKRKTIMKYCVEAIKPRSTLKTNRSFPKSFRKYLNFNNPCLALMKKFSKHSLPMLVKGLKILPEHKEVDEDFFAPVFNGPRLVLNPANVGSPEIIEVIDLSDDESSCDNTEGFKTNESSQWLSELISRAKDAKLADKFIAALSVEEETVICLDDDDEDLPESDNNDKSVVIDYDMNCESVVDQPDSTEDEIMDFDESQKEVNNSDKNDKCEVDIHQQVSNECASSSSTVKVLGFSVLNRNDTNSQSIEVTKPIVLNKTSFNQLHSTTPQTGFSQDDLNVALNNPIIFNMTTPEEEEASRTEVSIESSFSANNGSILSKTRAAIPNERTNNSIKINCPKLAEMVSFPSTTLASDLEKEHQLLNATQIIIQPLQSNGTSSEGKITNSIKVLTPGNVLPSKGARIRVPKQISKSNPIVLLHKEKIDTAPPIEGKAVYLEPRLTPEADVCDGVEKNVSKEVEEEKDEDLKSVKEEEEEIKPIIKDCNIILDDILKNSKFESDLQWQWISPFKTGLPVRKRRPGRPSKQDIMDKKFNQEIIESPKPRIRTCKRSFSPIETSNSKKSKTVENNKEIKNNLPPTENCTSKNTMEKDTSVKNTNKPTKLLNKSIKEKRIPIKNSSPFIKNNIHQTVFRLNIDEFGNLKENPIVARVKNPFPTKRDKIEAHLAEYKCTKSHPQQNKNRKTMATVKSRSKEGQALKEKRESHLLQRQTPTAKSSRCNDRVIKSPNQTQQQRTDIIDQKQQRKEEQKEEALLKENDKIMPNILNGLLTKDTSPKKNCTESKWIEYSPNGSWRIVNESELENFNNSTLDQNVKILKEQTLTLETGITLKKVSPKGKPPVIRTAVFSENFKKDTPIKESVIKTPQSAVLETGKEGLEQNKEQKNGAMNNKQIQEIDLFEKVDSWMKCNHSKIGPKVYSSSLSKKYKTDKLEENNSRDILEPVENDTSSNKNNLNSINDNNNNNQSLSKKDEKIYKPNSLNLKSSNKIKRIKTSSRSSESRSSSRSSSKEKIKRSVKSIEKLKLDELSNCAEISSTTNLNQAPELPKNEYAPPERIALQPVASSPDLSYSQSSISIAREKEQENRTMPICLEERQLGNEKIENFKRNSTEDLRQKILEDFLSSSDLMEDSSGDGEVDNNNGFPGFDNSNLVNNDFSSGFNSLNNNHPMSSEIEAELTRQEALKFLQMQNLDASGNRQSTELEETVYDIDSGGVLIKITEITQKMGASDKRNSDTVSSTVDDSLEKNLIDSNSDAEMHKLVQNVSNYFSNSENQSSLDEMILPIINPNNTPGHCNEVTSSNLVQELSSVENSPQQTPHPSEVQEISLPINCIEQQYCPVAELEIEVLQSNSGDVIVHSPKNVVSNNSRSIFAKYVENITCFKDLKNGDENVNYSEIFKGIQKTEFKERVRKREARTKKKKSRKRKRDNNSLNDNKDQITESNRLEIKPRNVLVNKTVIDDIEDRMSRLEMEPESDESLIEEDHKLDNGENQINLNDIIKDALKEDGFKEELKENKNQEKRTPDLFQNQPQIEVQFSVNCGDQHKFQELLSNLTVEKIKSSDNKMCFVPVSSEKSNDQKSFILVDKSENISNPIVNNNDNCNLVQDLMEGSSSIESDLNDFSNEASFGEGESFTLESQMSPMEGYDVSELEQNNRKSKVLRHNMYGFHEDDFDQNINRKRDMKERRKEHKLKKKLKRKKRKLAELASIQNEQKIDRDNVVHFVNNNNQEPQIGVIHHQEQQITGSPHFSLENITNGLQINQQEVIESIAKEHFSDVNEPKHETVIQKSSQILHFTPMTQKSPIESQTLATILVQDNTPTEFIFTENI